MSAQCCGNVINGLVAILMVFVSHMILKTWASQVQVLGLLTGQEGRITLEGIKNELKTLLILKLSVDGIDR